MPRQRKFPSVDLWFNSSQFRKIESGKIALHSTDVPSFNNLGIVVDVAKN